MAQLGQIQEAQLTASSDVNSKVSGTMGTLNSLDLEGSSAGATVTANADNLLFKNGAYDFVGINEAGVQPMIEAIDKYCTDINATLEKMNVTASTEGVFAGQYKEAITEFIKAIQASCLSNVNSLKAFKADLQQVVAAMQSKDTSIAGNVSADASSVNKSASESN